MNEAVSNFIEQIVLIVFATISSVGAIVRSNRSRSKKNSEILGRDDSEQRLDERVDDVESEVQDLSDYLKGDDDHPDRPGIVQQVSDVSDEVHDINDKMEE